MGYYGQSIYGHGTYGTFDVGGNTAPEAPYDISVISPLIDFSPIFKWHEAYDAEGDLLTYEYTIWDTASHLLISALVNDIGSMGSYITYEYPTESALSAGSYIFKVRASDGSLYSTWSDDLLFVLQNLEPSVPYDLSLLNVSIYENDTSLYIPVVQWHASTDPEGMTVSYTYKVWVNGDDEPEDAIDVLIYEENNDYIIYTITPYLQAGDYKFKVRAFDGDYYSDWSEELPFILNVRPLAPTDISLLSPQKPQSDPLAIPILLESLPKFSWVKSVDPDVSQILSYPWDLYQRNDIDTAWGDNPIFSGTATSVDYMQVGNVIGYRLPLPLFTGKYKLVLKANDGLQDSVDSSEIIFKVWYETIDIDKVFVVAPGYVDETLGKVKFFETSTRETYNLLLRGNIKLS